MLKANFNKISNPFKTLIIWIQETKIPEKVMKVQWRWNYKKLKKLLKKLKTTNQKTMKINLFPEPVSRDYQWTFIQILKLLAN